MLSQLQELQNSSTDKNNSSNDEVKTQFPMINISDLSSKNKHNIV